MLTDISSFRGSPSSEALTRIYRPLPWEEQLQLFEKFGTTEWQDARERLFAANAKYAILLAFRTLRRWLKQSAPGLVEDAISVSSAAMLHCIDTYGERGDKQYRFTTYCHNAVMRKVYTVLVRDLYVCTFKGKGNVQDIAPELMNPPLQLGGSEYSDMLVDPQRELALERVVGREAIDLAWELVDKYLDDYNAEIFRLTLYGKSQTEIAEELGVSRQAVNNRVAYCRRRLRRVSAELELIPPTYDEVQAALQ